MAEHAKPNHPYHLVDPSPWPVLGSLSAGVLAVGALLFMHNEVVWVMLLGLLLVLFTMFVWWRDVVREAQVQGHHTPVVSLGHRYGMALFIASEVMFFAAFFWAFFDASLFADEAQQYLRAEHTGGVWPPAGMEVFAAFDLPFLNTLILLTSGVTVTWAHEALFENNRPHLVYGLGITVLLGITFTALQVVEYTHAPFSFAFVEGGAVGEGGIYPSTFFMATGFHGFHVIVGTLALTVCFFRALAGHFSAKQHVGFEASAWYWHFVDVVWLFLFAAIYWWGGN